MGVISRRIAWRILVLDDERSVRRTFQLMLADAGLSVDAVATTEEAVERLRREPYDVLVLDTAMAGSRRRALLDVARREFPTVAVVVASGEPSTLRTATDHTNVDAVLAKPVLRDELVETVTEAVRSRLERSGTRLRRQTAG